MKVTVHYRITQDRAGIPQDFAAARRFSEPAGTTVEEMAKAQLAADYQIPASAVVICNVER